MIRLNLVASLLLATGAAAAQPVLLGVSYNQTIEYATALLVRAAQPGIQASTHPGNQSSSPGAVERFIQATAQLIAMTLIVTGYFAMNRLSVLLA